jgi:hypothetical protein
MRTVLSRHVLSLSAARVLLSGCGGSELPILFQRPPHSIPSKDIGLDFRHNACLKHKVLNMLVGFRIVHISDLLFILSYVSMD